MTVSERGRTEEKGKEAEQCTYLGTASLDLWPGTNQDPQEGEDLCIANVFSWGQGCSPEGPGCWGLGGLCYSSWSV